MIYQGAERFLNAWEAGLNRSALERPIFVLAAAFPELNTNELLTLSIGQRDHYLWKLRELLFGSKLDSVTECPECCEKIEWQNSVRDFLGEPDLETNPNDIFTLDIDDYSIAFRLPNSLDIDAAINNADQQSADRILLARCIVGAEQSGSDRKPDQLPDSVIEVLSEKIEAHDQLSNIRIELHCPGCSHRWTQLFDIASFLWAELEQWATRILQTVNVLASAYGWTERDILNLSTTRRQLYLGMLER